MPVRTLGSRAAPVAIVCAFAFALALLLLTACAAPLQDPWGLAVSRGEAVALPVAPQVVQADLGLMAAGAGSLPVEARLYAEPGRRYRLDIFGFLTPVAASWLWRDNAWVLVRHDTRQVVKGRGITFAPGGVPGGEVAPTLPDVHAVLGSLWGSPLPGFGLDTLRGEASPPVSPPSTTRVKADTVDSGVVVWTHAGKIWRARFDPQTGLCREAATEGMTLRYSRHALRGGRVVPGRIDVLADTTLVLTLTVKDLREAPVWKKNPFELVVPAGYEVAESPP